MFSNLSSFARAGILSIGLVAGSQMSATGAPLTVQPAVPNYSANKPILVEQGEGRGGNYSRIWPRVLGGRNWNGPRGGWSGDGNWKGGGKWKGRDWSNNDWNGRRWHRRNWGHRGWNDGWGWGSGLALGLGFGVPLGYYGGYDSYYDDPYYYGEPVYRPRVYRDRSYNQPRRYDNDGRRRYYQQNARPLCNNEYLTGPKFSGCKE